MDQRCGTEVWNRGMERILQGGMERGYGTGVVPELVPDLLFWLAPILVANRRYLGGCLMIMNQLVMNQPEFMKPGLAFSQIDPAPSAGPWPSVAEMTSCG